MKRSCQATTTIEAPPRAVWDVVSDVTRTGEWSGECRGCEWVAPAATAVPGARFRGRNRRGGMRWTRVNEVVTADEPRELVWRTVAQFPYLDSTDWRLRLEAAEGGTEVTENFEIVKMSKAMDRLLSVVMPAHRDRSADLAADLARLKALVESSAADGAAARAG